MSVTIKFASQLPANARQRRNSPLSSTLNSTGWLSKIAQEMLEVADKHAKEKCNFVPASNVVDNLESMYRIVREIGTGGTSRVVLAENIHSGEQVALKQLRKDDESNLNVFITEYDLLNKLSNHNNIVRLKSCYMDKYNYYIATEYCSGGTLLDLIMKSKHFSEFEASKYIKTIIETIDYCHSLNISHRDLKPGNLIFDKQTSLLKSKAKLKIIDFGVAIEMDDNDTNSDYVGTLIYMPPEAVYQRYGWEIKMGDMWSIGIIAYILVCGIPPFFANSQKNTVMAIMTQELDWPQGITLTKQCKSFINHLLCKDSKARYNTTDALKHEWLSKHNNSKIESKNVGNNDKNENKSDDESVASAKWKDSMSVNLKSAQVYNNNLASFEANFDYLVINATLSTMLTADKVKMVSGLRDALPNKNENEANISTQQVLFQYLRKKGLNKEDAHRRSVYLVDTIQQIPMDNGLSYCIRDKSQLSRSNSVGTQTQTQSTHSSRKLPMVASDKKNVPNNADISNFITKHAKKDEGKDGKVKKPDTAQSQSSKLAKQIDLGSQQQVAKLEQIPSTSRDDTQTEQRAGNQTSSKTGLFSCFCCC